MKNLKFYILIICFIFFFRNTNAQQDFNNLKINQVQSIGSHNSYHKKANKFVLNFLKGIKSILPKEYNPNDLDYEHEPLNIQLDSFKLNSFEIDIYADTSGGLFYKRKKNNILGKPKSSKIEALKKPGFKVFHIPDIDYNSHYLTFIDALQEFKSWSKNHPNHLPIYILIECKEESIANKIKKLHFTKPLLFTPKICDNLDNEIKAVFGNELDNIITPDKIRGNYTTLNTAVLENNWPTINESRGKFIFIMMGATKQYIENHPSLKDRVMFTFSPPNQAEAAFVKVENPTHKIENIQDLVKKGYIVRTRADVPNNQNRTGDYTQQKAAFQSGAQLISSDYYTPDNRYKKKPKKFTNYNCKFPNNTTIRKNPINTDNKVFDEKIAK